jgi:hypothetical protein
MYRFLRFVIGMVCWAVASSAAGTTVIETPTCQGKDLSCYEDQANIRSIQLASEQQELYVAVERAKVAEFNARLAHRSYALWGQYIQGWILLVIGVGIVVVGMVLSWKQVAKGLRDGTTIENAFEFGKDGVRLRSPVVGLFIFGASLWFFNTYIEKVYTITVLPNTAQPNENQTTGQTSPSNPKESPAPATTR